MKKDKWKSWEELVNAPDPVSLINEPTEPEIEPPVETATERARRRWGISGVKEPTQ